MGIAAVHVAEVMDAYRVEIGAVVWLDRCGLTLSQSNTG